MNTRIRAWRGTEKKVDRRGFWVSRWNKLFNESNFLCYRRIWNERNILFAARFLLSTWLNYWKSYLGLKMFCFYLLAQKFSIIETFSKRRWTWNRKVSNFEVNFHLQSEPEFDNGNQLWLFNGTLFFSSSTIRINFTALYFAFINFNYMEISTNSTFSVSTFHFVRLLPEEMGQIIRCFHWLLPHYEQ